MDERTISEMDTTENIETEVIASNNMLTLITTEDGIPTSTEVTVLTTALGDVPIMTASLGTLSDVPHTSARHPAAAFVTSQGGAGTVFTTSLVPSHTGQAVVLSDGQIAVMGPDGVSRTILVHTADPNQIATIDENVHPQNIVTVNLEEAVSPDFSHGTAVVLTEAEAASLTQQGAEVLASIQEEVITTTSSSVDTLVQGNLVIGTHQVENAPAIESDPSSADVVEISTTPQDQSGVVKSLAVVKREGNENAEVKLKLTEEVKANPIETDTVVEPVTPVPPAVPSEVVCLVCYQFFPNPKVVETESSRQNQREGESETTEQTDTRTYGRTLGKFFEVSRINMSIVTRRSYKDYEVPMCQECSDKLMQTEKVIEEMREIEKKIYFLRQEIKDKIVSSHCFFKQEGNSEILESRKKCAGLAEILAVVDRIRVDIINDGRPPKIPRSISGAKKPGRKPKKISTEAPVPQPGGEPSSLVGETSSSSGIDGQETKNEAVKSSQNSESITPSQTSGPGVEGSESILPDIGEEEKEQKPAIRTSFGRLIKRPAYMINELTEDELSDLGESSEDNYEELEVKPAILPEEGEPGVVNEEEIDEEDPAWSPGRGMLISEKIGVPVSSSDEESEGVSDYSDADAAALKPKVKKEGRVKKFKKSRTKSVSKKPKTKKTSMRQSAEHVNYEVKVIQLDGTELMTINTTGEDGGIGLEPDITQKVMDSQAVIMVKNQLFGKRVQCPHCPRSFTDPARRDVHVKKKHEGVSKPFECQMCSMRFSRQDHLRNHMKRHTRPPKEKSSRQRPVSSEKTQCCEFCEQRFRNKSELIIHTRLHTGEKPFKCEHCSETFVSALKKEFHIEQLHPEVPPLRCEFCPKAFFRQHRLRIHAVSHTGEKTNICEICGKSFSQAAMLRYHQTTHEELNLKQFKCQECNRVFANPQNLKSHMESQHQKMYRHRCTTCGRGYTQMSHLRRHVRTHSGEQPYVCSYCPKRFTSGAALKIHVRIHTGERPYWCSQCEKGFRSKTKLGRHMKTLIHSGEKDKLKKETLTTEIEAVDVNAGSSTAWTEIVGIITGV